jgi:hypothetical protein
MVIHFSKSLQDALEEIGTLEQQYEFVIQHTPQQRMLTNSDDILQTYGEAKWEVLELLNEQYQTNFNHHNWLTGNKRDEVAYFLNEVGSNSLSHSEFKAPHRFHLWLGKKGFIIGVEQKGRGFNAKEVHRKKVKKNKGAAFTFFRKAKSSIFFDAPERAQIVFLRKHCSSV